MERGGRRRHVYWASNAPDGGIFSAPLTGGAATAIVGQQPNPDSLAVDGTNVYFTTAGNPTGTVVMVPLDGGTPVTLATGQTSPAGISIDPNDVYWADFAFGRVLQLVK